MTGAWHVQAGHVQQPRHAKLLATSPTPRPPLPRHPAHLPPLGPNHCLLGLVLRRSLLSLNVAVQPVSIVSQAVQHPAGGAALLSGAGGARNQRLLCRLLHTQKGKRG